MRQLKLICLDYFSFHCGLVTLGLSEVLFAAMACEYICRPVDLQIFTLQSSDCLLRGAISQAIRATLFRNAFCIFAIPIRGLY